jgi:3-deoxy-D-manno-octulosonic-acid transferase
VSSLPPLIRELRRFFPGVPLVVSTISESGQERARRLGIADQIGYFPADLGSSPGRWLDALSPRLVILLETELWPGFYRALRTRGTPTAAVSMRVAPNRVERYRRLSWLFQPLLEVPDYLGAQTMLDRSRILLLGAPPGRTRLSGDLKFDQVFENLQHPGRARLQRVLAGVGPRLVAGSVHPQEDAVVLDAFLEVRKLHPSTRLTIAPRHLTQVSRIEKLCRERELDYRLRSGVSGPVTEPVLLLDTHGELALCYEGATAAFVGGSLVPIGGHSPLEPAVFQVPVQFGTQAFNFEDMNSRLIEAGGAEKVEDGEQLQRIWNLLISTPAEARRRGEAAHALARSLGGAAEKVARHLRERWPEL